MNCVLLSLQQQYQVLPENSHSRRPLLAKKFNCVEGRPQGNLAIMEDIYVGALATSLWRDILWMHVSPVARAVGKLQLMPSASTWALTTMLQACTALSQPNRLQSQSQVLNLKLASYSLTDQQTMTRDLLTLYFFDIEVSGNWHRLILSRALLACEMANCEGRILLAYCWRFLSVAILRHTVKDSKHCSCASSEPQTDSGAVCELVSSSWRSAPLSRARSFGITCT